MRRTTRKTPEQGTQVKKRASSSMKGEPKRRTQRSKQGREPALNKWDDNVSRFRQVCRHILVLLQELSNAEDKRSFVGWIAGSSALGRGIDPAPDPQDGVGDFSSNVLAKGEKEKQSLAQEVDELSMDDAVPEDLFEQGYGEEQSNWSRSQQNYRPKNYEFGVESPSGKCSDESVCKSAYYSSMTEENAVFGKKSLPDNIDQLIQNDDLIIPCRRDQLAPPVEDERSKLVSYYLDRLWITDSPSAYDMNGCVVKTTNNHLNSAMLESKNIENDPLWTINHIEQRMPAEKFGHLNHFGDYYCVSGDHTTVDDALSIHLNPGFSVIDSLSEQIESISYMEEFAQVLHSSTQEENY